MTIENEDLRTREHDVKNASENIQKRIDDELKKERLAMSKELEAYR